MALPETNITTTLVGNAIGNSSRNVGVLCTAPTINKWSRYRPGYFYPYADANKYLTFQAPRGGGYTDPRGTDTEINDNKEGYKLGDFRGYNHTAIIPYIDEMSAITYGSSDAGTASSRGVTFYLGEVNWKMLEETVYRSLNNLVEPLYLILTDEGSTIKGSALLPTGTNGNITISYNFTVPNAGNSANFTARIGFGVTAGTINYRLGNNYGAVGERTFSIICLAPKAIYAVQFDDTNITGGDNPPYISIQGIGVTDNYFSGTNAAVWKFTTLDAFESYTGSITDYYRNITADWYIKGFSANPSTEYLAKTASSFASNSAANTVTLPVSGSPSTFTDGDEIILILRNIDINY